MSFVSEPDNMNTDIMSTGDYDSKVVRYRYMNMVAVMLLISFLVWWGPGLSSGAFYFLVTTVAYVVVIITKSWLTEREFFQRKGPIDRVFSCLKS